MFGFTLSRFSFLNIGGSAASSYKSSSAPGEWYNYSQGHYRIGITLHLVTIIPAGFLAVFQFVPVIRHKLLIFHRINGYLIVVLAMLGNVGALMIARRAFGGGLDVQSAVGTLVILTTIGIGMAYYNIKRLQIDQHRAWMLRTWFYFGTIITTRIIMITSATVISILKNYYTARSCGELAYWYNPNTDLTNLSPFFLSMYPDCANATLTTYVAVNANMNGGPENIGAALGVSFGMGLWLSIILHALGVEIYLALTPAEGERLRNVSYERQLEAGYEHPGSAGLTVDRWGDAEAWVPKGRVAGDGSAKD